MINIIKAISTVLILLTLSCSYYAETRKVNSCTITDLPYGEVGKLKLNCPDLHFTVVYDNDPEGKDRFIHGIEGIEIKRTYYRKIDPYRMMSADVQMEGYAVEEVWEGKGVKLTGFEFFTDGGRVCYDWEEGYRLELERGGDKLVLLDEVWEGTECR